MTEFHGATGAALQIPWRRMRIMPPPSTEWRQELCRCGVLGGLHGCVATESHRVSLTNAVRDMISVSVLSPLEAGGVGWRGPKKHPFPSPFRELLGHVLGQRADRNEIMTHHQRLACW